MNIDSDDLLARIRHEYPVEFELCRLKAVVDLQQAEIERLTALIPHSYSDPADTQTFLTPDVGRHG